MLHRGTCQRCRREANVDQVVFTHVLGAVIVVVRSSKGGVLCLQCARKLYHDSIATNLAGGWWSVISVIALPFVMVANHNEWRRFKAQQDSAPANPGGAPAPGASTIRQRLEPALAPMAARTVLPPPQRAPVRPSMPTATVLSPKMQSMGSDGEASLSATQYLMQLPWSGAIGKSRRGVGQQQLSWPVGLAVLAGLIMFVSLPGVLSLVRGDGNNPPAQAAMMRAVAIAGMIFGVVLMAVCIFWHRAKRRSEEMLPDLMGNVFPADAIYTLDRAHASIFALATGHGIRVVVAIQNRYDTPTEFRLLSNYTPRVEGPELRIQLDPFGTAIAWRDIPYQSLEPVVTKIQHRGGSLGTGGSIVRRASRMPLRAAGTSATFAAMAILGGHFAVSLGGDAPGRLQFADNEGKLFLQSGRLDEAATATSPWNVLPFAFGDEGPAIAAMTAATYKLVFVQPMNAAALC